MSLHDLAGPLSLEAGDSGGGQGPFTAQPATLFLFLKRETEVGRWVRPALVWGGGWACPAPSAQAQLVCVAKATCVDVHEVACAHVYMRQGPVCAGRLSSAKQGPLERGVPTQRALWPRCPAFLRSTLHTPSLPAGCCLPTCTPACEPTGSKQQGPADCGALTCTAGLFLTTEPHELCHQVPGDLQVLITVTGLGTEQG